MKIPNKAIKAKSERLTGLAVQARESTGAYANKTAGVNIELASSTVLAWVVCASVYFYKIKKWNTFFNNTEDFLWEAAQEPKVMWAKREGARKKTYSSGSWIRWNQLGKYIGNRWCHWLGIGHRSCMGCWSKRLWRSHSCFRSIRPSMSRSSRLVRRYLFDMCLHFDMGSWSRRWRPGRSFRSNPEDMSKYMRCWLLVVNLHSGMGWWHMGYRSGSLILSSQLCIDMSIDRYFAKQYRHSGKQSWHMGWLLTDRIDQWIQWHTHSCIGYR